MYCLWRNDTQHDLIHKFQFVASEVLGEMDNNNELSAFAMTNTFHDVGYFE